MRVRCPSCQADQPAPAPNAQAMCLGCGHQLSSPAAAPEPIRLKVEARPTNTAEASDDDFSGRTMSVSRLNLRQVDALPSLAALVAEATQEAAAPSPRGEASATPPLLWHIRLGDGSELGPMGQPEVLALREQGRLDARAILWRNGLERWLPLEQALQSAAGGPPPPPPPEARGAGPAVESFLSPLDPSATQITATTVVRRAAPAGRPKWQLVAAGVGGLALLGLAAIGVTSILRGRDPAVAVTSKAPAEPSEPAPAEAQADAPPAPGKAVAEPGEEPAEPPAIKPRKASKKGAARRQRRAADRHEGRP